MGYNNNIFDEPTASNLPQVQQFLLKEMPLGTPLLHYQLDMQSRFDQNQGRIGSITFPLLVHYTSLTFDLVDQPLSLLLLGMTELHRSL